MRTLLVVCVLGGIAHADKDADAIKKQVKQTVYLANGATAFDADTVFAADAFAMVPGGYANGPAAIDKAMVCSWSNPEGSYDIKLGKVVVGHQGDVGWATIDLAIRERAMDSPPATVPYRMTELFTRDGATWKAHAVYISMAIKDRAEDWGDDSHYVSKDSPPGAETRDAPMLGWLAHAPDLAAHLHKGADVIVLGSAPGERGGASLLGGWKKLVFATDWSRAGGDGKTWAWVVARVVRDVKVKDGIVKEPYWLLALAVKGAADWEIVSLHYGQDYPDPGDLPGCGY
ncbi:MAG TPA: hypothetical protein VL463_20395 [Kofleriaceae bacterium]|nr:hypothetical protein [Kofleriaceae bacterium]